MNDGVTINLTDGKVSGRTFRIQEGSYSDGVFEESDNGLNLPASTATLLYTGSHSLVVTSTASTYTYRMGTPLNYQSVDRQSSTRSSTETRYMSYTNLATGCGGVTKSTNSAGGSASRVVSGTWIDLSPLTSTYLSTSNVSYNNSQAYSINYSPTTICVGNSRASYKFNEWTEGTIARGVGERTTSGSTAMWGTTTSNGKTTPWDSSRSCYTNGGLGRCRKQL